MTPSPARGGRQTFQSKSKRLARWQGFNKHPAAGSLLSQAQKPSACAALAIPSGKAKGSWLGRGDGF